MTKDRILLFVDGDKYDWDKSTISGAELRVLAAIPQGAQIFLKVPSSPGGCARVYSSHSARSVIGETACARSEVVAPKPRMRPE